VRDDEDEVADGRLRRLGESLAEVATGLHLDDPWVTAAVFSGWAELVGEAVAAHARPRVLRRGVLTVEVDSPAWATQLHFLEGDLVERLAGVAGLRIVVARR
jgi:hypothetical protein